MSEQTLLPVDLAPKHLPPTAAKSTRNGTGLSTRVAEIAVPIPVSGLFSYTIPPEWQDKARPGVRVRVPFRNREIIGYLVGTSEPPQDVKLKPLIAILDDEPVLTPAILELTRWIGEYYGSSWGEAIENALPKWVKYGKKAEKALAKEKTKELPSLDVAKKKDFILSKDQKKSLQAIQLALTQEKPKPILLYGVTGSGKSEIYIQAIKEVLKNNRSAICMVPEIALTEQIRRFFHHHFGNELEILHSKLTDSERFLAWKRIERGDHHIILGPRSAVFAPVQNLGLIIMDEEHEGSYKQETTPRYHSRDVAAWRANHEHALFVMGTATPSLETMYASENGEVERIDLTTRIDEKAMPEVRLIDLKDVKVGKKKSTILSIPLEQEIQKNLDRKEGTLLLLNRRGYSTYIHCPGCGAVESCGACQVSLTQHKEDGQLMCHYCNFQKPIPKACSTCQSPLLKFGGFGTEKVEQIVAQKWPTARIARMDTDSIRKRGSHEVILSAFRNQETDILIGTQMIAKGFDFPHVTLVGVVYADVGLMLPDFRSSERTFQLLTQVAGRAGRGEKPGRVLIQTYSPDHPSVRFAKQHDFLSFYRSEIPNRFELQYPPYQKLINFIVRSKDENKAYIFARSLRDVLQERFGKMLLLETESKPQMDIIGPAPLPFYKLRGHFRWHVMIKAPRSFTLNQDFWQALSKVKRSSLVQMAIDVDPFNIL